MATYAVVFDIKVDSTHKARRDSLTEQIGRSSTYWDGATSFAIVRSSESIEAFSDRLYRESKIVELKDLLLVVDLDSQEARARGPIANARTLKLLLPQLSLLGPG